MVFNVFKVMLMLCDVGYVGYTCGHIHEHVEGHKQRHDLHRLLCLIWLIERTKNKQQNNAPSLKNNAAAGYKGGAKLKLLKGAGLL